MDASSTFLPNRSHPYSEGAFCIKGIRGAPGITYSENRLLHPMRRTGERGEASGRASPGTRHWTRRPTIWRRCGRPEAIVGATSGAYFGHSIILALTLRSIGSPNWMINQDLCGGCRAVSARVTGLDIARGEDIGNARCALVVGHNPLPTRRSGRR
jgi:anaerobic selenocysteine-containing dehydrogenase